MSKKTDNFFIRNATLLAIGVLTLLIALASLVFYKQDETRNITEGLLLHTYEVTGHIQLLLNRLKDIELGQRGYILTGNEEYLEPYYDALKDSLGDDAKSDRMEQHHSVSEELAILRRLTSDNPNQQQNLDEMAEYADQLLNYWSSTIAQRKKNNSPVNLDFYRSKELMDHVRRLVAIMMAEENRLLKLRTDADEANTRLSYILTFSGLAGFYLVMVTSIWLYQRSSQRYTLELELNEEELKMQQEELQASNEEMETANEELEEQNTHIKQQSTELAEKNRLIEEKAAELQRASNYKSEFLANMSHELRTPLNSLLILAKLLAGNEEGNLTAEQVEEARIIYNGGMELLELINDILDLSKVEAGKLTFTAEDTYIEGIGKRLEQQFMPIAKQSGVAFMVKVNKNLPQTLHTDAQRLEQILKNLLANAFKFTEVGSVTLKIFSPHPQSIAFCVSDTGIGIDPAKFRDIFEAFQQENGSIDRHYGGTGLGLTIARKFAHMLGGEIQVESKKGEGSRFTLTLPLKDHGSLRHMLQTVECDQEIITEIKPARHTAVASFIPDDRNNIDENDKVLLIIEDDRHFASILMKMARERGYKALCAGDGKTGLVLALEQKVTAIILDLKLPDIDGMQVLDQLKHELRTRSVPVHIITGSDMESLTSLRKGAIGYLAKPVNKEDIEGVFTKIETLLKAEVKRVLIIEDDKKTQTAIQSLLRKRDTELTVVGTGAQALELVKQAHFDCIILDLQLPDMTGFTWLEKIEKDMKEDELSPVIIYTARDLTEEENQRLSHYTDSIIIKGARSPERLLDEVTLFLHSVESTLSSDQQNIIRMQHDPGKLLQGRTLLLVDDDMRNTFALSKILKMQGMKTVIAENGNVALAKLQQNTDIELVLMDIMMPIMDGYQTIRAIRQQPQYGNLPIIALTARAMPEEQEKCLEAGANDYLSKPVDMERLLTLLRVWLFKQDMAA